MTPTPELDDIRAQVRQLDLSRNEDLFTLGKLYNRAAGGPARSSGYADADAFVEDLAKEKPGLTVALARICGEVAKTFSSANAQEDGVLRLARLARIWAKVHPQSPPDPSSATIEGKPFRECTDDELDAALARAGGDPLPVASLSGGERTWFEFGTAVVVVTVVASVGLIWMTFQTHYFEKRLEFLSLRPAHIGAAGLVFAALDLRWILTFERRFSWARLGIRACNIAFAIANATLVGLLLVSR